MKKLLLFTLSIILFTGCGGNEESSTESFESSSESYESASEDGYADGTYCAEVDYYNPNTGTSSTYTLEVDVEDNELTKIHWPNGGWLDESHFSSTDISDGDASFTSDQGYDYTVKIIGEEGSCSTSSYIEEEEEQEDEYATEEQEDEYVTYEEENSSEEEEGI